MGMEKGYTTWYVDGLCLNEFGYNIETWGGDKQSVPGLRGNDLTVPFATGDDWMAKIPESRSMSFAMFVNGANPDGTVPTSGSRRALFERNWNKLKKVFWNPNRQVALTKEFSVFEDKEVGRNLFLDPGFESGNANSVANRNGVTTVENSGLDSYKGSRSLRVRRGSSAGQSGNWGVNFLPTSYNRRFGERVVVSAYIKGIAGQSVRLYLDEVTPANTYVNQRTSVAITTNGQWQRISAAATPSQPTNVIRPYIGNSISTGTEGDVFYIDAVQMEMTTGSTPSEYFDGSMGPSEEYSFQWKGLPNESQSVKVAEGVESRVRATAQAQFAGGLTPSMEGQQRARFVVQMQLADPFFYSDIEDININTVAPIATNIAKNPIPSNLAGFSAAPGSDGKADLTYVGASTSFKSYVSAKWSREADAASGGIEYGRDSVRDIEVVPGEIRKYSASVRPSKTNSLRAALTFFDAAGAQVGSPVLGTPVNASSATWTRIGLTNVTTPDLAVYAKFRVEVNPAAGTVWKPEKTNYVTTPSFEQADGLYEAARNIFNNPKLTTTQGKQTIAANIHRNPSFEGLSANTTEVARNQIVDPSFEDTELTTLLRNDFPNANFETTGKRIPTFTNIWKNPLFARQFTNKEITTYSANSSWPTSTGWRGNRALRLTRTGSNNWGVRFDVLGMHMTTGNAVLRAYVRSSASMNLNILAEEMDSRGNTIKSTTIVTAVQPSTTAWSAISSAVFEPQNPNNYVRFGIRSTSGTSNAWFEIGGLQIEAQGNGEPLTGPYTDEFIDGVTASPDADLTVGWIGAANASASTYFGEQPAGVQKTVGCYAVKSKAWPGQENSMKLIPSNRDASSVYADIALNTVGAPNMTVKATVRTATVTSSGQFSRRIGTGHNTDVSPSATNGSAVTELTLKTTTSSATLVRLYGSAPGMTTQPVWWANAAAYAGDVNYAPITTKSFPYDATDLTVSLLTPGSPTSPTVVRGLLPKRTQATAPNNFVAASPAWADEGSVSLKIWPGVGTNDSYADITKHFPNILNYPDGTFTVTAKVNIPRRQTGTGHAQIRRIVISVDGVILTPTTATVIPNTVGTHTYRAVFTMPTGAQKVDYIRAYNGEQLTTSGSAVHWDSLTFVEGVYDGQPFTGMSQAPDGFVYSWSGRPNVSTSLYSSAYPNYVEAAPGVLATRSSAVTPVEGNYTLALTRTGTAAQAAVGAVVHRWTPEQLNQKWYVTVKAIIPAGYTSTSDTTASRRVYLANRVAGHGEVQVPATVGTHSVTLEVTPTNLNQTLMFGGGGEVGQAIHWDLLTITKEILPSPITGFSGDTVNYAVVGSGGAGRWLGAAHNSASVLEFQGVANVDLSEGVTATNGILAPDSALVMPTGETNDTYILPGGGSRNQKPIVAIPYIAYQGQEFFRSSAIAVGRLPIRMENGTSYTVQATIQVMDTAQAALPVHEHAYSLTVWQTLNGIKQLVAKVTPPNTTAFSTHNLRTRVYIHPNATDAWVQLHNGTRNIPVLWRNLMVVEGYYTGDYFDGDTTPPNSSLQDEVFSWRGTAGLSESIREVQKPVALTPDLRATIVSLSSEWSASGTRSLRVEPMGSATSAVIAAFPTSWVPEAAGEITLKAKVRLTGALGSSFDANSRCFFMRFGTTVVRSSRVPNTAGVHDVTWTFTKPAGLPSDFGFLHGHTGGVAWIDELMVVEERYTLGFFDGSTQGARWEGDENNSRSVSTGDTLNMSELLFVEQSYTGDFFHGGMSNTQTYVYAWDGVAGNSVSSFGSYIRTPIDVVVRGDYDTTKIFLEAVAPLSSFTLTNALEPKPVVAQYLKGIHPQGASFDIDRFRVIENGVDMSGYVEHSGHPYWFVLRPGVNSIFLQAAGTGRIVLKYRPAWL